MLNHIHGILILNNNTPVYENDIVKTKGNNGGNDNVGNVETRQNIGDDNDDNVETRQNIDNDDNDIVETKQNIDNDDNDIVETRQNIGYDDNEIVETKQNIDNDDNNIVESKQNIDNDDNDIVEKKQNIGYDDNNIVESRHALTLQKTNGQMRFQNQGVNTISSIVGSYKSAVTKHCNRLGFEFAWQPRFHEHIIRDAQSFEHIQLYIANNINNWNKDKFFKKE